MAIANGVLSLLAPQSRAGRALGVALLLGWVVGVAGIEMIRLLDVRFSPHTLPLWYPTVLTIALVGWPEQLLSVVPGLGQVVLSAAFGLLAWAVARTGRRDVHRPLAASAALLVLQLVQGGRWLDWYAD